MHEKRQLNKKIRNKKKAKMNEREKELIEEKIKKKQ